MLLHGARGLKWADFYGLRPFLWGGVFSHFFGCFEIDHELPMAPIKARWEAFSLAYSADGINWRRLGDTVFIPVTELRRDQGGNGDHRIGTYFLTMTSRFTIPIRIMITVRLRRISRRKVRCPVCHPLCSTSKRTFGCRGCGRNG